MYEKIRFDKYAPELGEVVSSGYPIFNEWWNTFIPEHKKTLERKIEHAYWFNQICVDSVDRFKFYINTKLERIMPYYNKLYESELIKFDPMLNIALKQNGRSLENLVKAANSDRSKVGQAIRNFANSGYNEGHETGNLQNNLSEDITRTENETRDLTGNKDTTRDTTAKENVTQNVDGTGNSTTKETGTVNKTGTNAYSDTPQRDLSTQGIQSNYLTNYTATTDNEERNLTTTNEYTTNEETTRETTTEENMTQNEKWTENETKVKTMTQGTTHDITEDTTKDTHGRNFSNGNDDTATSEAESKMDTEKSTRDAGTTEYQTGFMNVSASSLLQAFRDTFINIDEMIINDLRDCFMEVF